MRSKLVKFFKLSKSALVFLLIALAFSIWGFLVEPGLLTQSNLSYGKWAGPKLRIAFFSDLHAGAPHIDKNYIKDLVERINTMSPDLILLGGDLVINGVVGGSPIAIEEVVPLLQGLKSRLGVYAVLGNHDWWNGGERIISSLESVGISVIDNKSKLIKLDSNFDFWLMGIGDDYTDHANVAEAMKQVTSNSPRVLFMHDPSAIFQMKNNFSFALAGHMHGGQIYVPGYGALITPGSAPRSWAGGWVDFPLGSLYVSKGIGTSIVPIRINALPEFVILDLNQMAK